MTGTPFLLPATISPSPTKVTGTAGNGQVAVWWTAPASNGGSAITGYQVQLATSVGGPYKRGGLSDELDDDIVYGDRTQQRHDGMLGRRTHSLTKNAENSGCLASAAKLSAETFRSLQTPQILDSYEHRWPVTSHLFGHREGRTLVD